MKLSSRIAGGLAVACALAVTIAGCSGGGQTSTPTADDSADAAYTLVEDGTIIVASDLANAPLDFVDEKTGEAQGFEIDLINAIAEKLGLECEVLPAMKFDTIVPLIEQGGKADVGVSNITITDARMEQVARPTWASPTSPSRTPAWSRWTLPTPTWTPIRAW